MDKLFVMSILLLAMESRALAEEGIYVKASYGVPWMVMFLIFFLILTPLLVAVLVSWIKTHPKEEEK